MGRPTFDWLRDPENALMNFVLNPWIKKASIGEIMNSNYFVE